MIKNNQKQKPKYIKIVSCICFAGKLKAGSDNSAFIDLIKNKKNKPKKKK